MRGLDFSKTKCYSMNNTNNIYKNFSQKEGRVIC